MKAPNYRGMPDSTGTAFLNPVIVPDFAIWVSY
jgi:hypothetical protein